MQNTNPIVGQPSGNRIEWIDIYKGIAIVLVVLGHTTGIFNQYIYQFHMAAFFIISGYTTNLAKRDTVQTILHRIQSLLIPYFTVFVLMAICFKLLQSFGLYNAFLTNEYPYVGLRKTLTEIFSSGNNYTYLMGAGWFVTVLFESSILHKILHIVLKKSRSCLACSFAIFLLGYILVKNGITQTAGFFFVDIFLIGQFYYGIGIFVRSNKGIVKDLAKYSGKIHLLLIGCLACAIIMQYNASIVQFRVDFPSRQFGFFINDLIAAVNGSLLLFFISNLITHIPLKMLKRGLTLLGRNTLAILYLHFGAFKVAYFLLAIAGFISFADITRLTPAPETGISFWPFIVIVSIIVSIAVWKAVSLIKPLGILLNERNGTHDMMGKIERFIKEKLLKNTRNRLYALAFLTGVAALFPVLRIGVTINDELQMRLQRMIGIEYFMQERFNDHIGRGIPMRAMAGINQCFGFLSSDDAINALIRVCLLLLSAILLCVFIKKLTRNIEFAVFTSVMTLLFLPLTFEHTLPSAFIGQFAVLLMYLSLSFTFFIKYLEDRKTKFIVLSMFLWALALMSYELIITFTLVYIFLAYRHFCHADNKYKMTICATIPPVVASILYLLATLMTRLLITTKYAGASFDFVSIQSSLKILQTLFTSALPDYYLYSAKYQYLSEIYSAYTGYSPYIRALIIAVLFGSMIHIIIKRQSGNTLNNTAKISPRAGVAIACCGVLYGIIPAIPNSVASLYQGNVNEDSFTSLPVSYFLSISIMLAISAILWVVTRNLSRKISAFILAVVLMTALPLQIQNSEFSTIHKINFQRLTEIESAFDTNAFSDLNGVVAAPELFVQHNTLAFNDNYWTTFVQRYKKYDYKITGDIAAVLSKKYILYPNNQFFVVGDVKKNKILSRSLLTENIFDITIPGYYSLKFTVAEPELKQDHGYYVYKPIMLEINAPE
jgi:fucose 4-O-acetylase-like acetyltransferase